MFHVEDIRSEVSAQEGETFEILEKILSTLFEGCLVQEDVILDESVLSDSVVQNGYIEKYCKKRHRWGPFVKDQDAQTVEEKEALSRTFPKALPC